LVPARLDRELASTLDPTLASKSELRNKAPATRAATDLRRFTVVSSFAP
jgi:hypothetical protein